MFFTAGGQAHLAGSVKSCPAAFFHLFFREDSNQCPSDVYLAALDQRTGFSRCVIYDQALRPVASAQKPVTILCPQNTPPRSC